ncbi:unnamed protein product (macronuclear) [Paramecium tetraurelia]|uniref:Protein kinase domain-containing protein n=1 Tax=Paramecium tetraurelia TaxID=5888 RepID=A0BUV5_PARTE|nr:uncharacterized protein GSPATT00005568001 [Paramecium tetraurelia]CAK62322.1 unnamed protein product [Paramecium tetraurelia]|eukprot:XP_001429720.1 hypothetical protein (macronuclear) [Paramecium tetraurelia strain d4-2]
MGSCQGSTVDLQQDLRMREVMTKFQVPMPYIDEYQIFQTLKQVEIIQHNSIPHFDLIYSKMGDSSDKMKNLVKKWRMKYQQHNHPNLLSIHNVSILDSMKLFIPYTDIILLIDKPLQPLTRHKKVIMKQPFSQDEILFLLDCVVSGLAFQQQNKIYPSGFDIDDIITVKTPFNTEIYKLVDRYQKPIRSNLFQDFIQLYDDKQTLNELKKTAFFSPAQIEAIPKKDKYLKHNRYKSDVFNFALIMIYLIQAKHPEIFDWKKWTIDDFALRKTLDDLQMTNFDENLLHIIEIMLIIEEDQRPDFLELDEMVSKLFSDLQMQRLQEKYQMQDFFIIPIDKPSDYNNQILIDNIYQYKQQQQQMVSQTISQHQRNDSQKVKQIDQSQASIKPQKNEINNSFDNNIVVTQGKLHYSNGFYYVGQICNRRRHGFGVYYSSDNQKVTEGTWIFDIPEGDVILYNQPEEEKERSHKNMSRKDWVQYKGQMKQGQKHGIGVLYFSDGSKYMGNFSFDQAHGKGQFEYQNKEQIIGTWQHDIYNG